MDTNKVIHINKLEEYCNKCEYYDQYSFEPCHNCIQETDFSNKRRKPKNYKKKKSLL